MPTYRRRSGAPHDSATAPSVARATLSGWIPISAGGDDDHGKIAGPSAGSVTMAHDASAASARNVTIAYLKMSNT